MMAGTSLHVGMGHPHSNAEITTTPKFPQLTQPQFPDLDFLTEWCPLAARACLGSKGNVTVLTQTGNAGNSRPRDCSNEGKSFCH